MLSGFGWEVYVPPMDVYETEDRIVVELELPEVERSSVKIVSHGNRLIIEGVKAHGVKKEGVRFLRLERLTGPFKRVVSLPFSPREENIKAVMGRGVLRIEILKESRKVVLEGGDE